MEILFALSNLWGGFLVFTVLFALYLIYKIRKMDEPFDEDVEEILEPRNEDLTLSAGVSIPQDIQQTVQKPIEETEVSKKMSFIEDAISKISNQVEQLTKISGKKEEVSIPQKIQQILESFPEQINQLKQSIAASKPSGPPVESPLVKEIASSIGSMQKQISSLSQSVSQAAESKSTPALPPDLSQKLNAITELKDMTANIIPFFQKIQSLNSQIDTIVASVNKISNTQTTASTGMPPETMAVLKNLMLNIDTLKTSMESQKTSQPMMVLFTKQMEEFQVTIQDLKKSLASGGQTKGAAQDVSSLLSAVQELRSAYNASTNAEEDLLSRITTKLDIIHQVITSQTLSSGGGGGGGSIGSSSGGEKDLF